MQQQVGRYTVRTGRGSTSLRCISFRSFSSYFICNAGGSRLGALPALLPAATMSMPVQLIYWELFPIAIAIGCRRHFCLLILVQVQFMSSTVAIECQAIDVSTGCYLHHACASAG